jgi:hypothetical protein
MSSRRVVDAAEVVALLVDIAADRPDYVQHPDPVSGWCRYVDGDQPACIAGHVFHRLGATVGFLVGQEGERADRVAWRVAGIHLTDRACSVLWEAQWAQDSGKSWGEVAAAAVAQLARMGDMR